MALSSLKVRIHFVFHPFQITPVATAPIIISPGTAQFREIFFAWRDTPYSLAPSAIGLTPKLTFSLLTAPDAEIVQSTGKDCGFCTTRCGTCTSAFAGTKRRHPTTKINNNSDVCNFHLQRCSGRPVPDRHCTTEYAQRTLPRRINRPQMMPFREKYLPLFPQQRVI